MDNAVVPDNKRDVVRAGDVQARQLGNVDSGSHGGRYRPGGAGAPVAGVDQPDRVIGERCRLDGECRADSHAAKRDEHESNIGRGRSWWD